MSADLKLTKTIETSPIRAGGPVRWTIRVTNQGPGPARAVIVSDQLPDGITVGEITASRGVCGDAQAGPALVCTLGDMGAGETATIDVEAAVDIEATGALGNSAIATSPDESDPGDNAAQAEGDITPAPPAPAPTSTTVAESTSTIPASPLPGRPVRPGSAASPAAPRPAGSLAHTGFRGREAVALGFVLLAAGACSVIAARRRRALVG